MKCCSVFLKCLLLGWLLTGCSSQEEADDNGLLTRLDASEKVYMHLRLCQPASRMNATRANGDYEDGLSEEYAIHNAVLLLFTRSGSMPEGNSLFLRAISLTDLVSSSTVPVSSEITQTHNYTVELDTRTLKMPTGHNRLEAFVVANCDGLVSVGNEAVGVGGYYYASGVLTFSDFISLTLSDIGDTSRGLFMMSAPIADMAGGGATPPTGCAVTTLTNIDQTKIFNTAAAAALSPAVEIYLERAAAKVQLTTKISKTTTDDDISFDPTGIQWDLENENSSYYVSRHVNTDDLTLGSTVTKATTKYRFIDKDPLQTSHAEYRIYWGHDVNYGDTKTGIVRHYASGATATLPRAVSDITYTTENTMDVENMKQDRSTAILLSVPFYTGASYTKEHLYYIAADGRYYTEALLKAKLTEYASKTTLYEAWKLTNPSGTLAIDLVEADDVATKYDGTVIPAGEVSFKLTFTPALATEADLLTVCKSVEGSAKQIGFYKEGRAYYKVMIKHFGDNETPLLDNDDRKSTYAGIYGSPAHAGNYLGRFGVLRDTFYHIEIEGIRQLGSAVVPVFDDTPDDDTEYLRLRIIILPWMMHDQPLDF